MLIIGHRGAAELAPENSIQAMEKGLKAGADMLEFDVRLTRDKTLIVIHDSTLLRTHKKSQIIRWSTLESIKQATKNGHKIATLEEVLDMFFGRVLLNLEIKSFGAGKRVIQLMEEKYIKEPSDWDNIIFSSFKVNELMAVRKMSDEAELALLHYYNPFTFMLFHKRLRFAAVGFNRLKMSALSTEVAKQLGLFVYAYTVNRPEALIQLAEKGVDGIVTDNPAAIREHVSSIV